MYRHEAPSGPHEDVSSLSGAAVGSRVLDLLKRAEHVLDRDLAATRDYVHSALALLDTWDRPSRGEDGGRNQGGGGLALWQRRRVECFVAENLGDTIEVKGMATAARLSPSHFCKAFKASFGITPHIYVMERRVEAAKRAMVSTSDALSEIALSCGFSDQAHLCRVFRSTVGDSPHRWRQARRTGP